MAGAVRKQLPTRGGKAGRTGGSGRRVMRREDRCRREGEKWEVGRRVSEACSVYRQGAVMGAKRREEGGREEGGRGEGPSGRCGIVVIALNVSFDVVLFFVFPVFLGWVGWPSSNP